MPKTPAHRMAFTMPAFGGLTNDQVAEILTFIRNSWGNEASPVTLADVARMRAEIARKPVSYVPEASQ